jgi:methionyl aminopeptidase
MQKKNIPIKTPEEIAIMREGGQILAHALQEAAKAAQPGISTAELDQIAENYIRTKGGVPSFKGYQGFPATLCTNIDEQIVHTIPSKTQILKEGDLLSMDCGCLYKEFHTDSTLLLHITDPQNPTPPTPNKKALLDAANEVLETAFQTIKPELPLINLCTTIGKTIRKHGYTPIAELTGHGIGRALHEPPHIPNQKESYAKGPTLKAGMTLAIEPIFTEGSGQIKTLQDKWTIVTSDNSLAVQIEHTILITENGCEILTKAS